MRTREAQESRVLCSKCGRVTAASRAPGWLVGLRRDGRGLVVRCPEHRTRYAERLADRDYGLKC